MALPPVLVPRIPLPILARFGWACRDPTSGAGGGAPLYGLSGFSPANYFQTAVGGGEVGVASGFGAVVLLRRTAALATSTPFMVGSNSNNGHAFYTDTSGYRWRTASGAAAFAYTAPSWTSPGSDLNKLDVHVGAYKPSGGLLQLWCSRDPRGSIAQTGYTAATAAAVIGNLAGNAFPGEVVGILTYRGQASDSQLRALYDAVRALGDVPAIFPLASATDADVAALAPRHWYSADTFTPNAGNLGALTNRNTSVGGQLNVAAGTIPLPSADAALNGQLSFPLTGTQWLISDKAASEFRFLHNQFESFFIYVPTDVSTSQVQFATTRPGDVFTTVGMLVQVGTTLSTLRVGNGSGQVILTPDAPFALVNGVGTYSNASYTEQPAGGPEYFFADRTTVMRSGNSTAAPSPADPFRTLVVGAGAVTFDGPLRGRVAEVLLFDRQLTEAERQTVRDYIRTRYGVDVITTTHRWSLRDALANQIITDGQLAPASLADTVTAAAIDRMDRQGSPVVRVIDAGMDGRRSYGALGFSASCRLTSAVGAGFRGSPAGFRIALGIIPRANNAGVRIIVDCANGTAAGYDILRSGTSIYGQVYGSTVMQGGPKILAASDLGVPALLQLVFTGSGCITYWNDTPMTPVGSGTYTPADATARLTIGALADGTSPADTEDIFGFAAENGTFTQADVTKAYQEWLRTGVVGTLGTSNAHRYTITADVIDNGGPDNGVPAQVLDRIGTDHLTRVGGLAVVSGGIANFSATNTISTLAGIRGNAAGFWAEVLFVATAGASDARLIGTVVAATSGWSMYSYGTTALVNFSDGAAVRSSAFISIASNVLTHLAIRHTGTQMETYVNGALKHTAVFPAVPAAAGTMWLGAGQNASSQPVLGAAGSDGVVPTPAEIATAAAAALSGGKVVGIPGKTAMRWSVVDDVIEAGGKVPAIVKDRQGATNLAVTNPKLEVAQRTERLWSYEKNPILYGSGGHSTANHFTSPTGGTGGAASFGGTIVFRPSAATASSVRVLLSALYSGPNKGFDVRTSATNSTISVFFINGSGGNVAGSGGSLAGLYGKTCIFSFQYDATAGRLRSYLNRAEVVVNGVVAAGYTPGNGGIRLGAELNGTTVPGLDNEVFGFTLWAGIAGPSQVQAQHDAILAADGKIQAMPGVETAMLIDLDQSARANGNALPATLEDYAGNNDMARAGTPTLATQYARAFGF